MERFKTIDVANSHRSRLDFNFLMHALCQLDDAKVMQISKSKFFDVELKINGHEVLFSEFMKHIDNQLNGMIAAEARDMMEKKLYQIRQTLDRFDEVIKDALRNVVNDSNLSDEDKEYYLREEY